MTWPRVITPLAAGAFEGVALLAMLRGAGAAALGLHAAGCCCAAAVLYRRVLQGPPGRSFVLLFSGMLFVPVLGPLGLAAVGLATRRLSSPSELDWVRTPIPRPPAGAAAGSPRAANAPRIGGAREARLDALARMRGRTDPGSVALLRRALKDRDEDVRLLAHALLESKSRAAYRGIHEDTRQLEEAPAPRRGALHRRLAFEHWGLAWLGLAQGECLDHALGEARRHALAALEEDPSSASLHFLLGRIDLRLGREETAEAALARAEELGMAATLLRPYLAEAAFLSRRFDLVRQRLAEASQAGETVDRMRRYWA